MLTSSDIIIVDADALIALFDINDAHSSNALAITQTIAIAQTTLLYPVTALIEATTTFQRKLHNPHAASRLTIAIRMKQLLVEPVDQAIMDSAMDIFNPFASKQNTMFDAVVAALAHRHAARAIFSFDDWYRKIGIPLITDVV